MIPPHGWPRPNDVHLLANRFYGWVGLAENFDGPRATFKASGHRPANVGESWSLSAIRAKSGKEEAFIFRMT